MLNRIISVKYQYLKLFNCVQTNYQYLKELFVLDRNAWNYFTECKQLSSGLFKNHYLQTIHLQFIYI